MKFGFRSPSPIKSIKARTTGKVKRTIKKSVNPFYGKKGMGWIKDPKKSAYNAVYSRTTFGVKDVVDTLGGKSMTSEKIDTSQLSGQHKTPIFRRTWFIVLLLFLFAPAGIFLLWKYTGLNKVLKAAISVFFVIVFISIFTQQPDTVNVPDLSEPSSVASSAGISFGTPIQEDPKSEDSASFSPESISESVEDISSIASSAGVSSSSSAMEGSSSTAGDLPVTEGNTAFEEYDHPESATYVLNTGTHKIHYAGCRSVDRISPENYAETNDLESALANGYDPCKICNPK